MGAAPTPRSRIPGLLAAGILAALPALAVADEGETRRRSFTCEERVADGVLDTIGPDGEIRLAGGGSVRVADVAIRAEGESGRRLSAWLSSLAGSAVRVREVGPPDRWGRAAAHLEILGREPIDMGDLLVAEGLAVVDPGQRDLLCRPDLLKTEDRARQQRLGVWRDGRWPVAAASSQDIERAVGDFAIVQGRVLTVGERRERTYLNFGRDWSRDFNVTIPRRSWADLKARGITADTLRGRTVRVRGTVEKRRSPTLDLIVPDMLELVDADATSSGRQ
jgi:endonuclease YncB( thermonuclease family)